MPRKGKDSQWCRVAVIGFPMAPRTYRLFRFFHAEIPQGVSLTGTSSIYAVAFRLYKTWKRAESGGKECACMAECESYCDRDDGSNDDYGTSST